MDSGEKEEFGIEGVVVAEENRTDAFKPLKYAVVLHNDDYTTMEFVVEVLRHFFHRSKEEASQIMLRIHNTGKGVAGVYSYDIAETKFAQVTEFAKARGFPLRCTIEPLSDQGEDDSE